MPTLAEFELTPEQGFEQAESDILAALIGAVDVSVPPKAINVQVLRGFDAEILNALMSNPEPASMPLVRLNIWQEEETLSANGSPVFAPFIISLFFFYYYGVPSTDPTFTSFATLRRRHLGACMRALPFQQPGLTEGIPLTSRRYWKWDTSRPRVIDYNSPWKTVGVEYIPKEGFNSVRMDLPVLIKTAQ